MPQTGDRCLRSGIYQGDCPDKEQIALSKGETFPPCRQVRRAVNWTLIRATVTQ